MKVSKLLKRSISLVMVISMLLSVCSFDFANKMAFGETVAAEENVKEDKLLISGNSQWKYDDTDTDLYTPKFYEENYDDSAWKSGKAPLGYPSTDFNQTFGEISKGTLVNNRNKPDAIITYYYRNTFNVDETDFAQIKGLKATVGIDDGFVMYINGHEVNRAHMPAGVITHSAISNLSIEPSDLDGTVQLDLKDAVPFLKTGKNSIAVSVHNRDNNSSDIYFDMNLTAVFTDKVIPVDPNIENPNAVPKQVNVHMGDDPSVSVNVTYTTIDEVPSKIVLNEAGKTEKITFDGTSSVGSGNKFFHALAVNDLKPNTNYEYTVGAGVNVFKGKFKTAPRHGSKDSFKFVYLADTQVANATDAKALGATLEEVNKTDNLSFVYLAGDVTDSAANETQWELLFNNGGAFPDGGQNMFGNNLVSVIQGNHDNNTMNRHINAPAEEGNIVYSYDYGSATFIMLNLEAARYDTTARDKQKEFLIAKVKKAKELGQWTVVGFHKSLITGASHITDSDIVDARKFWTPIFAQQDVDFVLQGHDHVYSRGFVKEDGTRAFKEKAEGSVEAPSNAPLYMVGGHAGGLKWYSKKNYIVASGDPLLPGYTFLDKNSTDDKSDVKKEQVIVELEVAEYAVTINTYMFKYDTAVDKITTDKYLYDSLKVTRNVTTKKATLSAGDVTASRGSEVNIPIELESTEKVGRLKASVNYDIDILTLEDVAFKGFEFDAYNDKTPGIITFEVVQSKGIDVNKKTIIANLRFKVKDSISNTENTKITFNSAESSSSEVVNGKNPEPIIIDVRVGTIKILKGLVGDIDNSGAINGDDALMLLQHLSKLRVLTELQINLADFNNDNLVNTADALKMLMHSVDK